MKEGKLERKEKKRKKSFFSFIIRRNRIVKDRWILLVIFSSFSRFLLPHGDWHNLWPLARFLASRVLSLAVLSVWLLRVVYQVRPYLTLCVRVYARSHCGGRKKGTIFTTFCNENTPCKGALMTTQENLSSDIFFKINFVDDIPYIPM